MAKNRLRHGDWVLICDSRKALLAFNAGDELAPNLQVRNSWQHSDLATHEQGTDKPGRAFSGADGQRSGTETTDFHRLEEELFLTDVAASLEQNAARQQIEHLIVVAPPRAMGILRRAVPPSLRKLVHHEIEKDYVRMPLPDVEQHLVKQLEAR